MVSFWLHRCFYTTSRYSTRLDLGDAPGRANTGDKMMTLVASALAGGDCIGDADVFAPAGRLAPSAA